MKKLLAILLAGILVFTLAACGGDVSDETIDPETETEEILEDEDFDEDVDADFEYEDMNDVKKVNMIYGDDENVITLNKPDDASFTSIDDPMGKNDIMTICANDYSWDAEIMGYKCFEKIKSNVPFVDYYFKDSVDEEYESYEEEVTDLGISFEGKPVKVIRYTFKQVDDDEAYSEIFLGFEYKGTGDKGLFGLKIYAEDEELTDEYLTGLFEQLTFIER